MRARSRPAGAGLQGWGMFTLHPDLERTSVWLGDLALCQARLHLDARFPWIVLVPCLEGASGIEDLATKNHIVLMAEISMAGRAVRAIGEAARRPPARLNIGIIGNITPQLHVHVVGRRRDDAAWPAPVWGHGDAETYAGPALVVARAAALEVLGF